MTGLKYKGGTGAAAVSHLGKLQARLARGAGLRVGFLEGATYPVGITALRKSAKARLAKQRTRPRSGVVLTVPMVAFANEFGDPKRNRPPRPFFRRMIAKESPYWGEEFAAILAAANYDGDRAMQRMGVNLQNQLQNEIRELVSPALSPATIERKGFDKPLIETSHMLQSVDFEVTR